MIRFRPLLRGLARFSLVSLILAATGCERESVVLFEPNLVHTHKYQIKEGYSMAQAASDVNWLLTDMFGTPDEPRLPAVVTEDESLAELVSLDRLNRASGPSDAEGRGLFRKHCADCHGVSGNGRGPTAPILNPYPRDFRMGIFKFKSTERGSKPAREDLARSIRNGISGSAMKAIPELTEEDIQALTDYVIYLSWRGELERTLVDDATRELDLAGGDRIIVPEDRQATDEDAKALFTESWEIAEDFVAEIGDSWLEAADRKIDVPKPPSHIPMADNHEQFVTLSGGQTGEAMRQSVARGREVFLGKTASCSKCHGEDGLGTGQTTDYDDWTKDWTIRVGIDPLKPESLTPLLARGAMLPITIHPRNFSEGYFRGGESASDLWIRIVKGIEGTPMPAATFVPGDFDEEDVWHLINFVRSLKVDEDSPGPTAPPTSMTRVSAGDVLLAGQRK